MGKIRVNTIGDEAQEKKQLEEAEKRRAAKKVVKNEDQKGAGVAGEEGLPTARTEHGEGAPEGGKLPTEPQAKAKKPMKKKTAAKRTRSPKYVESAKLRDKTKQYSLSEALDVLEKMKRTTFDETVELHINTLDKVNGNVVLPHGTGKQTKVAIFAPGKDATGAEKLLKDIEAGKIDFDVLIATPDAMAKLAKVARILGPRGLMPNPKTGTVTAKPEEVAEKFKGGQVNFKTEAKANVIHVAVGKMSFGKTKLSANISTFLKAVDSSKVKSLFVKATMSPSLKLVK